MLLLSYKVLNGVIYMLKEFKFGNYRSFKDEQILSLEAMNRKNTDLDDFNTAILNKDVLLKSAAIYGHNSFGKSNILKAVSLMKTIVANSTNTNFKLNIDYFKLDTESLNKPSNFELTFIMDEISYRYGFEVFDGYINREWLFRKKVREVMVFERKSKENKSISISTTYNKLQKYVEFTRDTELFLGSMIKNNERGEILSIFEWIVKKINIISGEELLHGVTSNMYFDKMIEKESIVRALKNADINISDIEILREEENFEDQPDFLKLFLKEQLKNDVPSSGKFYKNEEKFIHNIFNEKLQIVGNTDFNLLERESQGTLKLYTLIGPILDCLKNGSVLFIDELDSKLHHEIVKYVILLFHSLDKNKNNAQLIFNTHDFYLLREDIFRRDQIYFTDKDKYGRSSLYSLGDFKRIEKKTNILTHYLSGSFGSLGKIKSGE